MLSLVKHQNDPMALIARIEHLIRNPPENSRVIIYTPEMCAYFLEHYNIGNRPKKPAKIRNYARDMAGGTFGLTGDTIKYGNDGLLKDGQNRYSACIQAGVPFASHTVFGIDASLFARMDIGRTRTAADVFAIAGIFAPADTAAAVRWLVLLTSTNPLNRVTMANDMLLEKHRLFPGLEPSVRLGQAMRLTWGHPAGAMAALHYLFARHDAEKADEFFSRWLEGRFERRSDPIKFLQDRLLSMKAQNHGRVHEAVRNALVVISWNAFITNRRVTADAIQWHLGQAFPIIEG
jgi:hypothetical protein